MSETSGWTLSPLKETGGLLVGGVLSHVMYASTVEMPPPHPLPRLLSHPQNIPVPLPPTTLPPIPAPRNPLT